VLVFVTNAIYAVGGGVLSTFFSSCGVAPRWFEG
jgi:hypothetical protein